MSRPRARDSYVLSPELQAARTCYDHLAGRLGIAITDALSQDGSLTPEGAQRLEALGLDIRSLRAGSRVFVRPCLDWTERRPHLAGALGAAIAARLFELGWVERSDATRAVRITDDGAEGLGAIVAGLGLVRA